MEKADVKRLLIIMFVVVYCVAPDFFPGPIDDLLIALLGYLAQKRIEERELGL